MENFSFFSPLSPLHSPLVISHTLSLSFSLLPSALFAPAEEMKAAKIPLGFRDNCAHLLIGLNECRQANMYLPWRCEHERHSYEKCQYEE
jgi:NADH dehydrogenase (ubiquinone) 1 beta subcomplex subunit 7